MATTRHFLGWDRPCLHATVDWLADRWPPIDGAWDLSGLLLATPGARAGRRLLELLVERTGNGGPLVLIPPRLVTAGVLADRLHQPPGATADSLTCLLVRLHVIRDAKPDDVAAALGRGPDPDDLASCQTAAAQLNELHETLAADGVRVGDVVPRCSHMPSFTEDGRWAALASLQDRYEQRLDELGLRDPHVARLQALAEGRCRCESPVVLVATADLNRITRDMLAGIDGPVHALVHAPEHHADDFDALGCLEVERWAQRRPVVGRDRLRFVDRPLDQAIAVIDALADFAPTADGVTVSDHLDVPFHPDQITVGLGDEAIAPLLERVLGLAGLPARSAVGRAVGLSRPALALASLGPLLGAARFADLAAAVRHPDIEAMLLRDLAAAGGPEAGVELIATLDRCAREHLPNRLRGVTAPGDDEPGPPDARRLDFMRDLDARLQALVPAGPAESRPLPRWSEPIASALAAVYGDAILDRHQRDDDRLARALEAIAAALEQQAALDAGHPHTPVVTASEAIAFTLARVGGQSIPEESSEPAIELLGWLELQLDDAPVLVVTGVNEGHVPTSISSDAFLPDQLRRTLGLADNRRRLARDACMLSAITQSRPHVTLVSGRISADGDPLVPSRLLLTDAEGDLPERVTAFYRPGPTAPAGRSASPLLPHGARCRFHLPVPIPPDSPVRRLSVTGFAEYIACPYRFYLRHVLRLEPLDDAAVELDGAMFGSLAHAVLADLGSDDLAACADAGAIARFLSHRLDVRVRERFGRQPPAAVVLQGEQLRRRLTAFARWQAREASAGWRVLADQVESTHEAPLDLPAPAAGPFTITGRIDRIDEHPEHGRRIIDYKTADTAEDPETKHRRRRMGRHVWVDLQLPLYRRLAEHAGIVTPREPLQVGLLPLPKDLSRIDYAPANWDDAALAEALERARELAADIVSGRFWPPGDVPTFDDGLGPICMDTCADRAGAVRRTERLIFASHQP